MRLFDAEKANRIFNDPSVRPFVWGEHDKPIDVSAIVADVSNNVLIEAEGGVVLFCGDLDPGIYNVHTAFLETHRGRNAIDSSCEAYRWMFTHTNCMTLQTMVPVTNRAAALAARIVGFHCDFIRKEAWETPEGLVGVKYYSITYPRWVEHNAEWLLERGRAFHDRLASEFARLQRTNELHPDENCHDIAVGAALEMTYGGQPEKAVILYNRWARFAGYGQIGLLQQSPLVIDIGNAVLLVDPPQRSFKVIKCR